MQKKILVLEESKMVQALFQSALSEEDWDWEVHLESDPSNYLSKAKAIKPQVILLSNQDQHGDYRITRALAELPQTKQTPILLLTQARDRVNEDYLATLGVRGYLRKPFEFQALKEQVEDLFEQSLKSHQNFDELDIVEDGVKDLLLGRMAKVSDSTPARVPYEVMEQELAPDQARTGFSGLPTADEIEPPDFTAELSEEQEDFFEDFDSALGAEEQATYSIDEPTSTQAAAGEEEQDAALEGEDLDDLELLDSEEDLDLDLEEESELDAVSAQYKAVPIEAPQLSRGVIDLEEADDFHDESQEGAFEDITLDLGDEGFEEHALEMEEVALEPHFHEEQIPGISVLKVEYQPPQSQGLQNEPSHPHDFGQLELDVKLPSLGGSMATHVDPLHAEDEVDGMEVLDFELHGQTYEETTQPASDEDLEDDGFLYEDSLEMDSSSAELDGGDEFEDVSEEEFQIEESADFEGEEFSDLDLAEGDTEGSYAVDSDEGSDQDLVESDEFLAEPEINSDFFEEPEDLDADDLILEPIDEEELGLDESLGVDEYTLEEEISEWEEPEELAGVEESALSDLAVEGVEADLDSIEMLHNPNEVETEIHIDEEEPIDLDEYQELSLNVETAEDDSTVLSVAMAEEDNSDQNIEQDQIVSLQIDFSDEVELPTHEDSPGEPVSLDQESKDTFDLGSLQLDAEDGGQNLHQMLHLRQAVKAKYEVAQEDEWGDDFLSAEDYDHEAGSEESQEEEIRPVDSFSDNLGEEDSALEVDSIEEPLEESFEELGSDADLESFEEPLFEANELQPGSDSSMEEEYSSEEFPTEDFAEEDSALEIEPLDDTELDTDTDFDTLDDPSFVDNEELNVEDFAAEDYSALQDFDGESAETDLGESLDSDLEEDLDLESSDFNLEEVEPIEDLDETSSDWNEDGESAGDFSSPDLDTDLDEIDMDLEEGVQDLGESFAEEEGAYLDLHEPNLDSVEEDLLEAEADSFLTDADSIEETGEFEVPVLFEPPQGKETKAKEPAEELQAVALEREANVTSVPVDQGNDIAFEGDVLFEVEEDVFEMDDLNMDRVSPGEEPGLEQDIEFETPESLEPEEDFAAEIEAPEDFALDLEEDDFNLDTPAEEAQEEFDLGESFEPLEEDLSLEESDLSLEDSSDNELTDAFVADMDREESELGGLPEVEDLDLVEEPSNISLDLPSLDEDLPDLAPIPRRPDTASEQQNQLNPTGKLVPGIQFLHGAEDFEPSMGANNVIAVSQKNRNAVEAQVVTEVMREAIDQEIDRLTTEEDILESAEEMDPLESMDLNLDLEGFEEPSEEDPLLAEDFSEEEEVEVDFEQAGLQEATGSVATRQAVEEFMVSDEFRDQLSHMIEDVVQETIQESLEEMLPEMMDKIIKEELED